MSEWSSKRSVDTPVIVGPGKSYLKPEPMGVVLVISSWNYPVFTAIPPMA